MAVNADQSRTIATIAQDCRRRLQECAQDEQLTGTHWAQNRLSDFNLWDAGIGASAKEQNSLDARLREDNTAKNFVFSSLSTLKAWLDIYSQTVNGPRECCGVQNDSVTPETRARLYGNISKDEAKDSIMQLFQVLVKLGVVIRQSGAASHLKNADNEFQTRRNEYKEFEAEMASSLIWKRIQHMLTEDLEVSEVQKRYVEMLNDLQKDIGENRLAYETRAVIEANARRRHRFLFALKRADKLKEQSATEKEKIGASSEPVTAKKAQTHRDTTHQERTSSIVQSHPKSVQQPTSRSDRTKSSTTKLSTHQLIDRISEASADARPSAPPTVTTSKVNYPDAPKVDQHATLFTCPYCRLTIPRATAQKPRWLKHVSDDLRPYTCYLPGCSEVHPLFSTFQAWKTHILSGHKSLPKWECILCGHMSTFPNKASFTEHARLHHDGELEGENTDDFVEACEIVEEPTLDKCPICSIHEDVWLKKRTSDYRFDLHNSTFIEHIGTCIHEFSLMALPASIDENAVKERSAAPTGVSNLDSRSSLSSLNFSDRDQDRRGFTKADKLKVDRIELLPSYELDRWWVSLETVAGLSVSKHRIDFSLRGVPVVSQFVARDAEMQALEKALVKPPLTTNYRNVVVVHGLGGIGKTQLAVEFVRKHYGQFSAVFWLDGSSEASLKQSFVDMAQRLPRGELTADGLQSLSQATVEADAALRECQQWLSLPSNSHWLLIIDSVDRDHRDRDDAQAYDVKDYFPDADHGSILITSRLASLQRLGSGVKVGIVAVEQARVILESNAGKPIGDADVVLRLLSGLPLALAQAGSYMRDTNVSASTYARNYEITWYRLMEKQQNYFPLQEYGDQSMLTTWAMSYEQVRKQSEEAAYLLKLWGFLDNREVWYELIAAGLDLAAGMDVPTWLLEIAEDELSFGDAMGLLSRYSLVEGKEGTDSYSIHSVLHRWCGYLTGDKEQQELGCLAVELVASSVPSKSEAEFWKKRKRIIGHGVYVSRWVVKEVELDKKQAVEALIKPKSFHKIGDLLSDEDRQQAGQMYQRALASFERSWGPDHTETLDTVNNLGALYADLGKVEQAEHMYQRALAGYEKASGPDHTSTLNTVSNLGTLYADLGKLEQAEHMYQRALAGYEKALEPDHTSTLDTVNNLGTLYADLGKLEQAEHMYQRALAGYEKAWGPDHASTLNTVNNLGTLYADLGKIKQAEHMYQRALAGYEKAWGPDHTSTLDTVNNLGTLYADLGKLEQAEHMYQRALAGYEKAWGPDHASTLDTVNNLGTLYADLGKLEQAEHMYQRALAGYEKAWGPDHASTLNTVKNLGTLYADLGKIKQAEHMYQRALAGYEKAWGPDHTSTLDTVNNLGLLYKALGKLEEAEKMYQRALAGYTKAMHPDNCLTFIPAINNMWALASLRKSQGRVDDARHWYSQALLGYEKTFGQDHDQCRALRDNLEALVIEQEEEEGEE